MPAPRRASASQRAWSAVVASGAVSLLGIAAWLSPADAGHGTHTRLVGAPCSWVTLFDRPCATCGMTTAYTRLGEGDVVGSFAAQPMGLVLALATACVFWIASHTALLGSRVGPAAVRLLDRRVLWLIVGGLIAGWAYKMVTWGG